MQRPDATSKPSDPGRGRPACAHCEPQKLREIPMLPQAKLRAPRPRTISSVWCRIV